MSKKIVRSVFAVVGLSVMAFGAGCDDRDNAAIDRKLSEVRSSALDLCKRTNSLKDGSVLDSVAAGCEQAITVGEELARERLPTQLAGRTQGDEHVTTVRLESLRSYHSAKQETDGYDGVRRRCHAKLTYAVWIPETDTIANHAPDPEKLELCVTGALQFLHVLGKNCGVNLFRLAEGESEVCELKREPIQKPAVTRPASWHPVR